MSAAASSPFVAVFRTEVLFNAKRVVPYLLMLLFSANALLWWGWGPAVARGWAVNSDFYIVWLLAGFSFMTMPLFIALLMGDPVIRDFRVRVDPLVFSKPVRRAEYLLGKFLGNFFVLVCCQACFALTPLALQATVRDGMVVLPPRVLPYLQHFLFFVVCSSLLPAALFFTVGSLTRNVKVVYGLAVSFYPAYVAWQLTMKGLPPRWRVALDPMLANTVLNGWQGRSAEWLNALAVNYDGGMIANRLFMSLAALACLAVLHARFRITERAGGRADRHAPTTLGLAEPPERLYAGEGTDRLALDVYDATPASRSQSAPTTLNLPPSETGAAATLAARDTSPAGLGALPDVKLSEGGARAAFAQLGAALGVEFRLLRAERSLVVVAPLVVFVCALELAAYGVDPEGSYSAAYASRTAGSLLMFLFGVAVFYAGETMQRDRELRVEPLLWSAPAPDSALLLSKLAATFLLSASLVAAVGLAAACVQLSKGHGPLELSAYLKTYALVTLPGAFFMCAASVALNLLLRDKHLAYAVSLAAAGAVYYLSSRGFDTWLYNPALYNLWAPADLARGGGRLTLILVQRGYTLSLAALLLALGFLFFERRSDGGTSSRRLTTGRRRALLAAAAALLASVLSGLSVNGLK